MKSIPFHRGQMAALVACAFPALALANHVPKNIETVVVSGGRPTTLPTQIPTTIEGITGEQVEDRINATDSEDALKYFPSLNVRKRYIGDYDHAVLASRASGTGNSARSLVYADGIQLSNLLGNGATFTPRWGMVAPEEIERVDVLYGPFSAAYPGGSVGAVVDYQTRMPDKLEAHVKLSAFSQRFKLYATDDRYSGWQGSASVGDRQGAWSWWIDVSRLDNAGQPITFANKLVSTGVTSNAGVPVTGAIADRNPANKAWLIIGAAGQTDTVQDHAKVKLAYDISPVLRASYTLGWWGNDSVRNAQSYLKMGSGPQDQTPAVINIDGRRYDVKASDLAPSVASLSHLMQGFSLKRHARAEWDWEVAASKYDYREDRVRTPTVLAATGPGTITDMAGSGWTTLALKGIWRPNAAHVVETGVQSDSAHLRTRVSASGDWIGGAPASIVSRFNGDTGLQSVYAQDTWRFAPQWKTTLGARIERWSAFGGELANASSTVQFGERLETSVSPKAALSFAAARDWTLKASLGRAVRNPTVAELFQGSIVDNAIVNSDPLLRAEKSWTGEFSAERVRNDGVLRATVFAERTRDALYSQPLTATVNTVQNIGRIRTNGLELAYQADDVLVSGLSLSSSVTYADSIITENRALPASVGKRQPRVPAWRANLLATYHTGQHWTTSFGARYSGRQYSALDNSDVHGDTYMGVSDYLVTDVRVRYRMNRNWSASVGIDNLGNAKYWAFHPYPQRTLIAEVRWDL
ncbi:TonB-dependent receptor [Massilia sp. R2A-15]|uniref:TonB-dependent receptor n=1 Tax=Massilia sp. R2A-15 TaxID=3064278 RepID=UPI00273310E5|nr:TonB-dependent receptor [Massilia sp. R2A-15]WLI90489.1 TonB-dependent receptor [Massilia sp. R2A-15]